MPIKTACVRELKALPKDAYTVIVMRYFPFWARIKNKYSLNAPELGPEAWLLEELHSWDKRYGRERAWELSKFETHYRRYIVRSSKALETIRKLKEIAKTKDVYLICHEVEDTFCHRRILKDIMEKLY